ncbi:MAG TPA: UDP-N-acetylmuramate dehydrogenase [Burkholderiaceae bacterium]
MTSPLSLGHDVPLASYNTFGLLAKAANYLRVSDAADLHVVRTDPALAALPRFVLGGGSNIVLKGDVAGLVLHMAIMGRAVTGEDDEHVYVRAGAGENWHAFVQWTLAQGFGGLENLSLIPGTVGAAPIQNVGAYGAETKDTFHSVTVFDFETGETRTLDRAACRFAYRDSAFKHELANRAVIVDVTFALPKRWQPNAQYAELANELAARDLHAPTPREVSDAVIAIRTRKLPDPAVIGNAGSFFKNPVVPAAQRHALLETHPALVSYAQADGTYKLAAGWLIDQCGWKGKSMGPAGVYEKQALVLVNRGGATGADIMRLAAAIQADVQARFGVALDPEPLFI